MKSAFTETEPQRKRANRRTGSYSATFFMLVASIAVGQIPSTFAAGTCTKAANQSWKNAIYYDDAGDILQIEQVADSYDMNDRGLRAIGNKAIPCVPTERQAWTKYYCPSGLTVPKHPNARRVVYFGVNNNDTNTPKSALALCEEPVEPFVTRSIKCATLDPTDPGGGPACTLCFCLSRPCPPACCQ